MFSFCGMLHGPATVWTHTYLPMCSCSFRKAALSFNLYVRVRSSHSQGGWSQVDEHVSQLRSHHALQVENAKTEGKTTKAALEGTDGRKACSAENVKQVETKAEFFKDKMLKEDLQMWRCSASLWICFHKMTILHLKCMMQSKQTLNVATDTSSLLLSDSWGRTALSFSSVASSIVFRWEPLTTRPNPEEPQWNTRLRSGLHTLSFHHPACPTLRSPPPPCHASSSSDGDNRT